MISNLDAVVGSNQRPTNLIDLEHCLPHQGEALVERYGFDPARHHPFVFRLRDIRFAVVGSGTWKNSHRRNPFKDSARAGRERDFRGVMVQTCKEFGLRSGSLRFYRATEFGSLYATEPQCHVHFLIAEEGLGGVSPVKFSEMLHHYWENQYRPIDSTSPGIGWADVKPYDRAYGHRGIDYCLKREFDRSSVEREREDYLSPKLIALIGRQAVVH